MHCIFTSEVSFHSSHMPLPLPLPLPPLSFSFSLSSLCLSPPSLLPTDLPHDLWPGQCCDANIQPDRYDAAAVSLGWLSPVPGAHAAGFSIWLLGFPQQDGGKPMSPIIACKNVWQGSPSKKQKQNSPQSTEVCCLYADGKMGFNEDGGLNTHTHTCRTSLS